MWRDFFATEKSTDLQVQLLTVARDATLRHNILPRIAETTPSAEVRAAAIRRISNVNQSTFLLKAWADTDPFVRQAALTAMRRTFSPELIATTAFSKEPNDRLAAALLAGGLAQKPMTQLLPKLLADADPRVQSAAIQLVGERRVAEFRANIFAAVENGEMVGRTLMVALAAIDELDRKKKNPSDEINVGQLIVEMLNRPNRKPRFIAAALPLAPANHPKFSSKLLAEFLASPDREVQRQAVATMRERKEAEAIAALVPFIQKARRTSVPDDVLLAEAVAALPRGADKRLVLEIASDAKAAGIVKQQAIRWLQTETVSTKEWAGVRAALGNDLDALAITDRADKKAGSAPAPRSKLSVEEWLKAISVGDANVNGGRLVFFDRNGPGCFRCHRAEGRGAGVGPDLSSIATSATPQRMVESIVHPSREIAPMYQAWSLILADGKTTMAQYLGGSNENTQQYLDSKGETFSVRPEDIVERRPSKVSIMPESLAETMTPGEFRDLIAYLSTLKH